MDGGRVLVAVVEEAAQLVGRGEKHASQDGAEAGAAVGSGIGHRQRGAPGAAEDQPAVDAQVLANALDVGHQMRGGVVGEATARVLRPQPRWSNWMMW